MLKLSIKEYWQMPLLALLCLLSIFVAVFWSSWESIVSIWSRSDTFAHGFLVLPASLWLVWGKREVYGQIQPEPSYLGVMSLLLCGFGWLCADLSKVLVVEQFALVGMLVSLIWAVLGSRLAASMLFPLLFLFFMVPFGEDFVPFLMEYTATFTVWMLRLSGISVFREGLHFTLTSGSWSVIEACSGIRYLIASITLGLLYAYLNYTSYVKRSIFILAAILVPILANGLRAYMIVMIGHLSGMALATGVDHIIYGWLFFGLIMLLMFYIGSFWHDEDVSNDDSVVIEAKNARSAVVNGKFAYLVTLCVLLLWPFTAEELHARQSIQATVPPIFTKNLTPASVVPDWLWRPHFAGVMADEQFFSGEGEHSVGVYIANFGDESAGGELVNSQNTLISAGDNQWHIVTQSSVQLAWPQQVTVEKTAISGMGQDFLVIRWYRLGSVNTVNNYYAKWLQLLKRLSGDASPELMIVIYTRTPHNDYEKARERLQKIALACCG